MEKNKKPQLKWKSRELQGTFYTRGKSRIIWYRYGRETRISTSLQYSSENRKNALERVKVMLQSAISEFLEYKKNAGYAKITLNKYRIILKKHLDIDCYLDEKMLLQNHITKIMLNNKVNNITLIGYFDKLSSFFNYYVKQGLITENPVKKIVKPKIVRPEITIYSQIELQNIFEYFQSRDELFYWFIRFIYFTAFRLSEALLLIKSDYRDSSGINNEITVISKYKDRYETFPISSALKDKIINSDKIHHDKEKLFRYGTHFKHQIKFENH